MKEVTVAMLVAWTACLLVAVAYIFLCPFTKVEESFNLQAIHDHIYHGTNLSEFDHREFTGPLPRTFIGSIIVGYVVKPLTLAIGNIPKIFIQYCVRLLLVCLVFCAYLHFLGAVRRLYGVSVAVWSCLLLGTQFHFLFYASRPLPNTFAAVLALLACSYWLRSKHGQFVFFAGFAIIVFRCELAIMFGLMLLISLIYGNLNWFQLFKWIICTGVFSLGATVMIDSYYWQRWTWPEGGAFHYNAVLNKSAEWGTLPFFWYFYSALPRAMGLSLMLVPLGMTIDTRCLVMSAPAFGFVLLYSILPHKELRFILYVVPLLNVAAARACSVVWHNRSKSLGRKIAALIVVGHLVGNLLMTAVLLKVSYHNYPGGNALNYLNNHVHAQSDVNVHIDIYSAQTGVSRFLHEHSNWRYDKTEDKAVVGARILSYTHLLVSTPDEPAIEAITAVYSQTHTPIHTEMCYKNLQISKQYPFFGVRLAPCVWVFEASLKRFKD